jgi:RNA polymerase sigma-70 factor (ECF subfamily)
MLQAASALAVDTGELLARARAGDPSAFADIVHQHQAMVFSLVYHVVRDRPLAEDLAQEVFLELYRNLAHVETAEHLKFWLRRVASNRCIDRFRHEAKRLERAADPLPEVPVAPIVRDVWLGERLRYLVSELPDRARLVVTLRYQEELEPLEIAGVLGMSINTVKSHLRRSLEVLRSRLPERGEHS